MANGGAPGGGAAAPAVRRDANYEPLPNELQNVKLYKPEVDSKLGLVLFTPCELEGDTRPRIKSMREGAIAADSGVLEIDDIILKVNGQPAKGHTETTKMLKEAKGNITITMFRLKIEETPPAPPPEEAAPPVAGVMSFGAPSGGSWGDEVDAPPPKPKAWGGQPTLATRAVPAGGAPAGGAPRGPPAAGGAPGAPAGGAAGPGGAAPAQAAMPGADGGADGGAAAGAAGGAAPAAAPAPAPKPKMPAWGDPKATAAALGCRPPARAVPAWRSVRRLGGRR